MKFDVDDKNRCGLVCVKFHLNRCRFAVAVAKCLGGSLFWDTVYVQGWTDMASVPITKVWRRSRLDRPPVPLLPVKTRQISINFRSDLQQTWGGHVDPSPPRGDATDQQSVESASAVGSLYDGKDL